MSNFVVMTVYLYCTIVSNISVAFWEGCFGLQLDDMWVSQQLQILKLSFNSACHIPADQFPPTDNFHGYFLSCHFMLRELDFAKRAFTQNFDLLILG